MRALILDDNADDRTLAARALQQGFRDLEVIEASSPDDFERALADGGFDFAITDYQLRWTDGIKVLDRLIDRYPGLPVVMFTNTGNEEVAVEAMKHGLSDYVIKRHGQYQRLPHAVRGALQRDELRGRLEAMLVKEREAREEAQHASRLKEEFLATLSHELRTPLQAVLGWTHLLRQEALEPADRKRAVEVIDRNARAQARLIDDLLDLSRLETGKLHLDAELADVVPIVQSAVSAVEPMAEARTLRFLVDLPAHSPPLRVDPARMRQVVLNILTNAIKFSADGGTIRVSLREEAGHALIEVADQGDGIAPEFLPHIFDRFRQADGSTTRRAGGLGIGLAVAKKLVDAQGGTLSARSDGRGKGAVFTVRLPVVERRAADAAGPALDRDKPPSLKGVKALAIDDDEDSLDVLRRVLMHCDCEVTTARDAKAGLGALSEQRPDVVICDIGMPGEDGYSFIDRVRCQADDKIRSVPAIALTAFARAEDRERALLAGFNSHLAKPVDSYELLVLVASLAGVLERARRCEVAT